jgi:hypothetical protein
MVEARVTYGFMPNLKDVEVSATRSCGAARRLTGLSANALDETSDRCLRPPAVARATRDTAVEREGDERVIKTGHDEACRWL